MKRFDAKMADKKFSIFIRHSVPFNLGVMLIAAASGVVACISDIIYIPPILAAAAFLIYIFYKRQYRIFNEKISFLIKTYGRGESLEAAIVDHLEDSNNNGLYTMRVTLPGCDSKKIFCAFRGKINPGDSLLVVKSVSGNPSYAPATKEFAELIDSDFLRHKILTLPEDDINRRLTVLI